MRSCGASAAPVPPLASASWRQVLLGLLIAGLLPPRRPATNRGVRGPVQHVIAPLAWAGSYRSALRGHRACFTGDQGCFSLAIKDGPLPLGAVGAEWNDALRIHYEVPKRALGPADHYHACACAADCQHAIEFPAGTTLCLMRKGVIWLDEDEFAPTRCGAWGPALADDDAWYVVDYPALAPAPRGTP